MIWSTDMDSALVRLWTKGLSSPQIAVFIGGGISASAVRGRRSDLGLKRRGAAELSFAGIHKADPTPFKPLKPLPKLDQLGPDSAPAPWASRGAGQCAFPVGDEPEGLIACCGPIPRGSRRPYCLFHLDLTIGVENAA